MGLQKTKIIKLEMQEIAKKILNSGIPINIYNEQIFIDNDGDGKFQCKQILEAAVHEETLKHGDHYIITQTEMAEVCKDIILYVTKEAQRRLERIVRLGFEKKHHSIVAEGERAYEIEDEKEFREFTCSGV